MLFTTLKFILFLAICVAAYYLLPKKVQWLVLLFFSLLFYAGLGRRRIVIVLASACVTWVAAQLLERLNNKEHDAIAADLSLDKAARAIIKKKFKRQKQLILFAFFICSLGLLACFKFYNLAADTFTILPTLSLIMPVGISFYTLQIVGYIIDVYNKKYKAEKNILKTILFTTYFPQIIQGPINRFDTLQPQLLEQHSFNYDLFTLGLMRMLWGYFKKLVIADRFAPVVENLFANSQNYAGFEIGLVIVLYTIQLYTDFSGGIDIALGASELFGIILPENFKRPFFSKSISEFWRRWHITLGAWLRDYVFYPVTLSRPLSRLGKLLKKHGNSWLAKWIPAYISLFILWLCSGVWHGEGAQFILYGMYHGFLIMLGLTCEPIAAKFFAKHNIAQSGTLKLFRIARTFALVCIGELIFRSNSVSQAFSMFISMFSTFNPWVLFDGFIYTLGIDKLDFYVGIIAIVALLCVSLLNRKISVRHWLQGTELPIRWALCLGAIFIVVVFGVYGPGYDAVPFIYFKF